MACYQYSDSARIYIYVIYYLEYLYHYYLLSNNILSLTILFYNLFVKKVFEKISQVQKFILIPPWFKSLLHVSSATIQRQNIFLQKLSLLYNKAQFKNLNF